MYYNARWYDPSLGRFAQADALVPGGAQGYDRYAYVNNDPVRYTDPTGHCTKTDKDYDVCLEQLKYVEQTYSVDIKGTAHWTMISLTSIQKSMGKLRTLMGYVMFSNLFAGVTFQIGDAGVPNNGMGTTGHRDVILGKDVVNNAIYIKHETIHELAHIWDKNCYNCMSNGMMVKTGSYKENGQYIPMGIPPTSYAKGSPLEDWAESVTAYLYPSYAENQPWSQDRQDYVAYALANPLTVPIVPVLHNH